MDTFLEYFELLFIEELTAAKMALIRNSALKSKYQLSHFIERLVP